MERFTWNPQKRPTDSGTHEPIEELTRVALSKPVETEDGVLPAGSMGTVVGVYRGAEIRPINQYLKRLSAFRNSHELKGMMLPFGHDR